MNKSNQYVIISFTVMIMSIVYSSMASAITSHSCRLHSQAFYAHVNLDPYVSLKDAVEICDRVMPGHIRKQHMIDTETPLDGGPEGVVGNTKGQNSLSSPGPAPYNHNPTDCIEVVPNG